MKKIGLINIFIGEFPWFFKLFLKSCETNPSIDFFIFTDVVLDYPVADNIKIISFSLADFNKLATDKLGFKIDVKKGYKLCDFRPAFGILFSEYIEKYDFWGITDLDVIYGRIREFMTDELLEAYDIICVRNAFITACCMLYKNNVYINNLYKESKDYEMIFTSPKNYAFDETNFENSETFLDKHDIFKRQCEIESIQHVIIREEDKGKLKAHFDLLLIEGIPGSLKWDNGLFSYKGKVEFMLYHLMYYKCNIFASNHLKWEKIPNVYYIDKYNYRRNNSVLTRLKVFYVDYVMPAYWDLGKRIDYLVSYHILRKKVNNLEVGDYYYYLNKQKTVVEKDKNGYNFISIMGLTNLNLYRMTFKKNYFFAENIGFVFKVNLNETKTYKKFEIVYSNGHSNTYVKSENNIYN